MMRLQQLVAAVVCSTLVSLAGAAAAASIPIEVIHGGVADDPLSWDARFESLDAEYVAKLQLEPLDTGSCIGSTSCTLALPVDSDLEYLLVKANGFTALYEPEPGASSIDLDVVNWGSAGIGGNEFAGSWPKRGRYPDITSIRAGAMAAPMPEPGSAVLFAVGSLVVGAAARRRSRRSSGPA